jgi:hypothetical protein
MPGWYVFYFCSSPFSIEPEVLTSPRKLERFTVVGAWSDGAAGLVEGGKELGGRDRKS